jgi:hypothetical protein
MKAFKTILFFFSALLLLFSNSVAFSAENDPSKSAVKKKGGHIYRVDFPVGDLNTDINYPRKEALPDNTKISEQKPLSPAVPN